MNYDRAVADHADQLAGLLMDLSACLRGSSRTERRQLRTIARRAEQTRDPWGVAATVATVARERAGGDEDHNESA